jgi:4-amino-4-deoxy-L-arabinose transferase-like glycosyltransferase
LAGAAWGAIAVTTLFIGVTCWWLSQDRSIPTFDAGLHLSLALSVQRELSSGHLLEALTLAKPYPPFAYLIGALGISIGGAGVTTLIVTENLVFVPLLAFGCYQIGRRAFGPWAGFLAVVFALGSPLAIAQSHVFMIDLPETAMVAVSVWLIIATNSFSRVGMSALAGVAVGCGMLTKETFVFFVAGVVCVALARGGWRQWRSLAVFAMAVLVVALPWYVKEYATVHAAGSTAVAAANHPYTQDIAPARYSLDNFEWYFWNFINFQLYLPLFVFTVAGWLWMVVRLARRQRAGDLAPELMIGALVAWLAITETFVHDTRYSEPMLVYLAVIGTGWIVQVGRNVRVAAIAVLAVLAIANTLGTSFGVGKLIVAVLPGGHVLTLQHRDQLAIYADSGLLVGGPKRGEDVLTTLQALRRHGVRRIVLYRSALFEPEFSVAGLTALAQIAGLGTLVEAIAPNKLTMHDAVFAHGPVESGDAPPCLVLNDGTGSGYDWAIRAHPTFATTARLVARPSTGPEAVSVMGQFGREAVSVGTLE